MGEAIATKLLIGASAAGTASSLEQANVAESRAKYSNRRQRRVLAEQQKTEDARQKQLSEQIRSRRAVTRRGGGTGRGTQRLLFGDQLGARATLG